jgi:hypothetical protein
MLKKSLLKDYLFKVMVNLNKLKIKNNFDESIKINILTGDVIKYIHIFLENVDELVRNYNSEMRMSMKRELIINLAEIKMMFQQLKIN